MDYNHIKKEIINLIEDISERTGAIHRDHPEKDRTLDIDMVKDDLRLLYRNLELLKQTPGVHQERHQVATDETQFGPQDETQHEPVAEEPVAEEPVAEEPVAEEPVAEEPVAEEPVAEEPVAEEPVAEEPVAEEPVTEEPVADEPVAEEPVAEEPVTEEPVADEPVAEEPVADEPIADEPEHEEAQLPESELSPEPSDAPPSQSQSINDLLAYYSSKTIGEKYLGDDNSLHQRIASDKEDKSIGARMQQQPISSIRDAIGINEKFLFINELFKGDIGVYRQAMDDLNEKGGMQAAFDYLNELAAKYSWDANRSTDTIEKLANIVQRRYMR